MFYSASDPDNCQVWIAYGLKFNVFFKCDKMQLASSVLPDPTGPANK